MNVAKLARRGNGVSILCCLVLAADASAATGICDRAPQVRDRILERFPGSDCEDISDEDLTSIEILDLSDSEIGALKAGDFAGLTNLRELNFPGNELTSLPDDLFDGLTSPRRLWINNNELASLPEGIFDGLANL